MKSSEVQRRFTLRDAMFLIAASAPGFALIGSTYVSSGLGWIPWGDVTMPGSSIVEWLGGSRVRMGLVVRVTESAFPFLAIGSPVVFGLRLCRPRPSWRVLACQPGAVVCGTATFSMFAVFWLAYFRVNVSPSLIGVAIGVAWLILAATRCWRAEASWVDRLGRILGCCWLATVPLIVWFEHHR